MQDAFSRMELLVGNTGVKKLSRAKIAVFGLGGAGSQVAESLARCGVGSLTLIDHEKITLTNIGSQVLALHSTLGMSKVEAAKKRMRDIDENILVHTYETFYNEETAGMFELRSFDYIVDTMGTLSSKLLLISRAREERVPVISCLVKKPAEGNISFVTGTAGYLLAGEVVRDILSAGNVSHS